MMQVQTRRYARAFTLIELLIVAAILGLVMALSLPALAGARESGRQLRCGTNLKQFATAYQAYASDNKDRVARANWEMPGDTLPGWLYTPPELPEAAQWPVEMRQTGSLWNYINCDQTYHCPTDRGDRNGTHGLTSYLMNGATVGFPRTLREYRTYTLDLFRPDGVAAFEHSGDDWNDGSSQADEILNMRHAKGAVIMCFDGRVEWLPHQEAVDMLMAGGASRLWCMPDSPQGGWERR